MSSTSPAELLQLLVRASLDRRDIERRSLWLQLRDTVEATRLPRPTTTDVVELALAAATTELLAKQQNVEPPDWTSSIGKPEGSPIYLDQRFSERGQQRLATESPEPLRSRGFYAPAKYVSLL